MSRVFIGTNIFYNILFRTQLTAEARELLERMEDRRFYTSLTVINELLYISAAKYYRLTWASKWASKRKKASSKGGIPKPYSIWDKIPNRGARSRSTK